MEDEADEKLRRQKAFGRKACHFALFQLLRMREWRELNNVQVGEKLTVWQARAMPQYRNQNGPTGMKMGGEVSHFFNRIIQINTERELDMVNMRDACAVWRTHAKNVHAVCS